MKDRTTMLYELTDSSTHAPVATITRPMMNSGQMNVKFHTNDATLQGKVKADIARLAPGVNPTYDSVVDSPSGPTARWIPR